MFSMINGTYIIDDISDILPDYHVPEYIMFLKNEIIKDKREDGLHKIFATLRITETNIEKGVYFEVCYYKKDERVEIIAISKLIAQPILDNGGSQIKVRKLGK